MLAIIFTNDDTGDDVTGNYDFEVYINLRKIAGGRIEAHHRPSGWQDLIEQLILQNNSQAKEKEKR